MIHNNVSQSLQIELNKLFNLLESRKVNSPATLYDNVTSFFGFSKAKAASPVTILESQL